MLNKIKKLFGKKEFYQTDYDSLSTYSIEFSQVKEIDLKKMSEIILDFNEGNSIENDKVSLSIDTVIKFSEINSLMKEVESIIKEDYRETYFEAKNENWNFNYFLSNPEMIYEETLMVSNRIQDANGNIGDVIYPLLAIRKYNNNFYLWNLLSRDNNSK